MRLKLFAMTTLVLISIPAVTKAQQNQTVVSLESRAGYSSNLFLNPFFAEWIPDLDSGYGSFTGLVQTSFFNRRNVLDLTGIIVAEPVFEQDEVWKGGLGLINYRRKISRNLNVGLEGGGSFFSGVFERSSFWVQPQVAWFPSLSTSLTLKAGSNFRHYSDFREEENSDNRFDLYSLEFETWPSYSWQIKARFFGSLDALPQPEEQFGTLLTAGHIFRNGADIYLEAAFEQFQFLFEDSGDGNGGPPIGPPPDRVAESTTEADRIFRLGLEGSMPVSKKFSVFFSVDGLQRTNTLVEESSQELQASGGIRFSFTPSFEGKSKSTKISPEWSSAGDGTMRISVHYSGEGRLFLVGDFNDWNEAGVSFIERKNNEYVTEIDVNTGTYEYKVLLRRGDTKEWLEFSDQTYTVEDGFGSANGLLIVE